MRYKPAIGLLWIFSKNDSRYGVVKLMSAEDILYKFNLLLKKIVEI